MTLDAVVSGSYSTYAVRWLEAEPVDGNYATNRTHSPRSCDRAASQLDQSFQNDNRLRSASIIQRIMQIPPTDWYNNHSAASCKGSAANGWLVRRPLSSTYRTYVHLRYGMGSRNGKSSGNPGWVESHLPPSGYRYRVGSQSVSWIGAGWRWRVINREAKIPKFVPETRCGVLIPSPVTLSIPRAAVCSSSRAISLALGKVPGPGTHGAATPSVRREQLRLSPMLLDTLFLEHVGQLPVLSGASREVHVPRVSRRGHLCMEWN